MNLSEFDLHFGQLALARGHVQLFELLESTSSVSAGEADDLAEALVERGLLDADDADALRGQLDEMSARQLEEVIDLGDTIALQTISEQKSGEFDSMVDELVDPLESAHTLAADRDSAAMVEPAETMAPSPPDLTTDKESKRTEPPPLPSTAGTPRGDEERYEFVDELGRGGMGKILRARDRLLDREIALKTLLPETDDVHTRRQLLAEAKLTGKLEHPSIVPVYEVGRLPGDEPYYTMRVVPEHSLRATIEQIHDGDEDAPSLLHLAQIIRQVCLAVQFAHENGVVHRDLKPENILLGEYGEVFVIDWGIAKVLQEFGDTPAPEAVDEPGAVVGTPQYMAPEQARGDNEDIDGRTDIYAIGAILYELMTLKPVFTAKTVMALLLTIVQEEPAPPSQRVHDRQVPEPLEEITMRALSKDRDDRYRSAQALADELGLYIEGVKDQERHEQRARELIDEAAAAREDYENTRDELQRTIRRRNQLRDTIPGWADKSERVALWEIEERVEQLEVQLERKFGETTRLLSQSLGHSPLDEAHDALAAMYWQRFVEAERHHDRRMATHFENLVRQHDTGAFTERLEGRVNLQIEVEPSSATLKLSRIEEHHRRLVPTKTLVESTGVLRCHDIPHGRYQLDAAADGFAPVRMPIQLERLESEQIDLRLWPRDIVPEDFVVIPAGEFVTGPPEEATGGDNREFLDEFAIQKTPVTCGEYLEFLNDLAKKDLDKARQHAPRMDDDAESYFPLKDGKFIIPDSDAEGDAWDPNWPICIVNYHDATAYAQWRSRRDGNSYRLSSALEWEKAARGVDGRLYPWGSHFDPSFCRMRDSLTGKPLPAPVGSHPEDISPYGAYDMAGNVCEWTSTPPDNAPETIIIRGGAYNSIALTCRLYWYQNSPPSFRHAHYGFRLVLELPSQPGR